MRRRSIASLVRAADAGITGATILGEFGMIRQGLIAALLMYTGPLAAQERKPFQIADLFRVVTADNPTVSPDGAWVTFV